MYIGLKGKTTHSLDLTVSLGGGSVYFVRLLMMEPIQSFLHLLACSGMMYLNNNTMFVMFRCKRSSVTPSSLLDTGNYQNSNQFVVFHLLPLTNLCLDYRAMSGLPQSREDCSSEFPPDWADDARMAFLFSAFKENRDVDPTDWDGKMDFWTPLIVDHCRRRGAVCVILHELNESLRRKGSAPLGLGTVLLSMYRYSMFILQYLASVSLIIVKRV